MSQNVLRNAAEGTATLAEQSDLERLYRMIRLIRRVEEEIARVYPSDVIKSPIHLSIGQEAVSAAVCDALAPEDIVFGTYRGHALYLAKGGDLDAMMSELYGKAEGCARGKGGSMHLIDTDAGMMGASAIVASTVPHAVGYAYAQKVRKSGRVVVSFFGEGAMEEGACYESLNFAAQGQLPVLFVCENNGYAIHADTTRRLKGGPLAHRVGAMGIAAERVISGDSLEIRRAAASHIGRLRAGDGPAFLECITSRWRQHVGPDDDWSLGYRRHADNQFWEDTDPVTRLGERIDEHRRREIDAEIEDRISKAITKAEETPFPGAEELDRHVYS